MALTLSNSNFRVVCAVLIYVYIFGLNGDSFYGILAKNNSLVQYTVNGEAKYIVKSEFGGGQKTNLGLSCYDSTNYRYYYLYQNDFYTPVEIGITAYDLFNNVSYHPIQLTDYFSVYRDLENAFLLSCNPNNGDLYIFGTSIFESNTMTLISISFPNTDSSQWSKYLPYNVTKIREYFQFNSLQYDSYINQPHIFDPKRNTIWFAHYFGNYINSNAWIWYNINPLTGDILNQQNAVNSPNFTYLEYDMNNDKIIGARIVAIDDIGTMQVNLHNPTDFSIYRSYGVISNFYPCSGRIGVSSIDYTNNIWYIINNVISNPFLLCDETVISALDISHNMSYIGSSTNSISKGDMMVSMSNVKYYDIIAASATINNKIINTTNDKFVSYTIDMGQIVTHLVNLSNPQLIYLASQLSPNILRIGGTDADYTYYEVGDENPCNLPQNQSHGYYCYTMKEFESLVEYAKKTNSSLLFGLSIGYALFPSSDESLWNKTNTKQFLRHLRHVKGYTNEDIWGFELGNEVSDHPYTDAEPQADAFLELSKLINDIWDTSDPFYFKLLGFDNAGLTLYHGGNFTYYPVFVNITCQILSGLTYHVYIGGDSTMELQPEHLDRQYMISNKVDSIFSNSSGYNLCADNQNDYNRILHNIAAGEIAYHSGENVERNLLNTYIDGFWYLDAFGTLGNLGHAYIFRQTMADNGYGLVSLGYKPHPDYFTAVLAKNLFSNKVVGIYSNQQHLRIYARCLNIKYPMRQINNLSPQVIKNGIVISYLNLFFRNTTIAFDSSVVTNFENTTKIYLWSLTASNATNLLSLDMKLNGEIVQLDADNKVPNLNGKLMQINWNENKKTFNIQVPETSYGFIVFTQTNIDACSD